MANANNLKYAFCAFCDTPDPTSREHLLAAWIWKAAKEAGIKTTDIAYYESDYQHVGWATMTKPGDGTIPIMCHDCNTRWGSSLQASSIATLKPFIIGGWNALDKKKRMIIARWFANQIMVRELLHPHLAAYTQEHRKAFRFQNRIPKKLNIWIGRIQNPGFFSIHRALKDINNLHDSKSIAHITAQEVGHIVLVGFGAPTDGSYGSKSLGYMALHNVMKAFGFVPLLVSNFHFDATFPDQYPHIIPYEDLSMIIEEMTYHLLNPLQNWDYTTLLCQPVNVSVVKW